MQAPDKPGPDRLISDSAATANWWENLKPGLKAAVTVGIGVIILEFISDILPVVGFLVTMPFAVVLYYIQGMLTGHYLRNDRRYPGAGVGQFLRSAAISAVWTSLVISTVVTVIDSAVLAPITLGAFLAALPLVLASGLVDTALNFLFTLLGAWLFCRFSGGRLVGVSCAIMTLALAGLCLVIIIAAGLLVAGGIDLIHHL